MQDSNNITLEHKKLVFELTKEVNAKYKDTLYEKKPKYRDPISGLSLRGFIEEVLKTEIAEVDRKRLQSYLDSNLIDETEEVVNEKVANNLSRELDKRILQEVKKGNLPEIIKTRINENKRNSKKITREETNAVRRSGSSETNSKQ